MDEASKNTLIEYLTQDIADLDKQVTALKMARKNKQALLDALLPPKPAKLPKQKQPPPAAQ